MRLHGSRHILCHSGFVSLLSRFLRIKFWLGELGFRPYFGRISSGEGVFRTISDKQLCCAERKPKHFFASPSGGLEISRYPPFFFEISDNISVFAQKHFWSYSVPRYPEEEETHCISVHFYPYPDQKCFAQTQYYLAKLS